MPWSSPDPDSQSPIALLTARERNCLELVGEGFRSKEIAVRLGISHHTVDQHLKAAVRKLGATSRQDAARLLRVALPPQSLGSQAPDVASASWPPTDWLGEPSGTPALQLAVEEPPPGRFQPGDAAGSVFPARAQGKRNDLTIRTTLLLIVTLIAALLIGFGVLMTGIQALVSMRASF
ncbi:helix-turn-helix domain-containing protein [Sphingomonas sp. CJ99]